VDPWPLVYRGLCLNPRPDLVRGAVERLDGLLRLRDMRVLDELRLEPDERALCEELGARPTAVADLLGDERVPRARAELLLYVLALGRHLERTAADVVGPTQLGASGVRAHATACADRAPHVCLDVAEDATGEEIRAAYFRLARVWHPDRLPPALADVRPACEEVFAKMTDAFRVLMEKPLATELLREPVSRDSAAPPSGRPPLVSLPPPTVTMTDVDRALSRADFAKAGRLASALIRTGAHGPAARAVVAMCDAAGANASFDQVDSAIVALDKILGGDPECVRALFYRGVLAKRVGRIDAAVRDFRRIVRLDPDHVDAQRELRLADARARSSSGEQTAATSPTADASRPALHARRVSDRERTDLEPLPGPPPRPGSGLRALLAKVVGRS
jgi:tetratricopeptide (TPR) repeat protein